jgi:ABC-type transport system involved in multi-copper enzyme maturation permease subunit
MNTIFAIAKSTFKETMRQRVLLVLLLFGVVTVASSVLFSYLSTGEEFKFVVDMGLGAMLIFGLLMATVLGAFMIPTDVERRIIFTILSKPVRRMEFIFGKFLGALGTIAMNVVLMGIVFLVVYFLKNKFHLQLTAVEAVGLVFFQLAVILSIAVTVSTIATPWFTVIFTMFTYFVGCMNETLHHIATHAQSTFTRLSMWVLTVLVPHFENFDLREKILLEDPVPGMYLVKAIAYALAYIAVMMAFAYLLFNEREF